MSTTIHHASRAVVVSLALCLTGTVASAEALASKFSFLVVEAGEDGEEKLVSRNSVKPTEIIHYELRHKNLTDSSMGGLVIAAPVPDGVTISLGSESSSVPAVFEVQAELDPEAEGLEWSTLPATRMVPDDTGTLQNEPLPEAAIVAVRWSFSEPLKAGDASLNSYRVQVN